MMYSTALPCLPALAASSVLMGATPAAGQDTDAMRAEVQTLRQEVAELRAQLHHTQPANWMDERRAEETRALIEDVLRDAQARASLLQDSSTAGHNGKFFLASEDGDFRLNITGQFQFRWLLDTQDGRADETESGFQLRRGKVHFTGTIGGDPNLEYRFTFAGGRSTGTVVVERAQVLVPLGDGLRLSMGKYKIPFLRQELLSSTRQVSVDRGIVTEFFTLDFSEQVELQIRRDRFRAYLSINDGGDEEFSNFGQDPVEIAGTARIDLLLAGNWRQARDNFAWSGEDFAAFLGAAIHGQLGDGVNAGAPNLGSPATSDYLSWTLDASIESNNLAAFGSITGGHIDPDSGASRDLYGLLIQIAYTIDDTVAPFARYEWIDDDLVEELQAVTVGINWFINEHRAKLTADAIYIFEGGAITNPHGNTAFGSGIGISGFTPGEDLLAVRVQFQLLF